MGSAFVTTGCAGGANLRARERRRVRVGEAVIRLRRAAALFGIACAALAPATARAGPRADFEQTFSTPVPGASAGTDTRILYKNPTDPNAKPIPVREEVFTFPAGTTFDNSVVPYCTVPDAELELLGPSGCPADTWVGGGDGDTSMSGFPGAGETPVQVAGFNAEDGVRLVGGSKPLGPWFPTRAIRQGRVVTVQVPQAPGGPPDGQTALRRIHHVFPARSAGGHAYVRTPPTCPPSGHWTFEARFTFADNVVEDDTYEMPCTP
jgi:hypothetical protein